MRLGRALAIAVADFKSLWRERVVVFWAVAWPVIWVTLVASVFVPPEVGSVTLYVGAVNLDEGFENLTWAVPQATVNASLGSWGNLSVGKLLVDTLRNVSFFKVLEYSSADNLLGDLERARLDLGVAIPENFSRSCVLGTAKLYVYVSGEDPRGVQVNRGFAQGFFYKFSRELAVGKARAYIRYLEEFSGDLASTVIPELNATLGEVVARSVIGLANPVDVVIEERTPRTLADRPLILGWYTVGAIGMTLMYSGMIFGAGAVVVEKERGRLDRMVSAGVRASELLLGKTLSAGATMLVASVAIVLTSTAIGARILWSPLNPRDWLVPLNLLLAFLVTMSIGFTLSLLTKTSRAASSLGTALGLLLSFIAGIWLPKFMLPQPLRAFADSFPVTWAVDAVRAVVVYGEDIAGVAVLQVKALAATVALVALGVVAYRKTISRYVEVA